MITVKLETAKCSALCATKVQEEFMPYEGDHCITDEEWVVILPKDSSDDEVKNALRHMLKCQLCYRKFRELISNAEKNYVELLDQLSRRHEDN